MNKPNIAISCGDIGGIGPEIAVKTAIEKEVLDICTPIITGPKQAIEKAISIYAPNAKPEEWKIGKTASENTIFIENFNILNNGEFEIGKPSSCNGRLAYETVRHTTLEVMSANFDAIVTAPVCKESINMAGIKFQGHTEMIAELNDCQNFTMMQSDKGLRVVFVTCHIPITQVPQAITEGKIIRTTQLLHKAILADGISNPKIAIAGLNPHAGEGGYMGTEEIDTIIPAMNKLQLEGLNLEGPFPADTLFVPRICQEFDGIVCMYHDQGHIPFKMVAFDRGVNSTLGLPIIRTSVDHGTAFNIAWQNNGDIGSLKAAVLTAARRANLATK